MGHWAFCFSNAITFEAYLFEGNGTFAGTVEGQEKEMMYDLFRLVFSVEVTSWNLDSTTASLTLRSYPAFISWNSTKDLTNEIYFYTMKPNNSDYTKQWQVAVDYNNRQQTASLLIDDASGNILTFEANQLFGFTPPESGRVNQ